MKIITDDDPMDSPGWDKEVEVALSAFLPLYTKSGIDFDEIEQNLIDLLDKDIVQTPFQPQSFFYPNQAKSSFIEASYQVMSKDLMNIWQLKP